MKRAFGVGLAVVAGLLLVSVALVAILVKPERVKEDILARLREKSGYTILAGPASLAAGWSGAGIRVRDLEATAPDSSLSFAVRNLSAFVKLFPLLRGRVELDKVILEQPAYVMRSAVPGATQAANPESRAAALAFLIVESWTVRGGSFRQSGPRGEIQILGMDLQGSFRWDDREGGQGKVSGEAGGGSLISAGRSWPLPPFRTLADFRVGAAMDSVSIPQLEVASGAVRAVFTGGYVREPSGWGGALQGRIDPVRWADVQPLLPAAIADSLKRVSLDGSLALTDLRIRQEAGGASTMRGEIHLEDVSARVGGAPAGLSGFHATVVFTQDRVDLEGGKGLIAGAPVAVDVHVAGKEPRTATAHLLTTLLGATVGQLLPAGSGWNLTGGEIAVDLTAQSVVPGGRIPDLTGRLDLSGLRGFFRKLDLREGGGTIRFSGGAAEIQGLHASLGRSDFSMEGTVPDIARPWATFQLTSKTIDLDELMPPVDSTRAANGPAPLVGLPGEGTVEIGTLHMRGQDIDAVHADARIDRDGIRLRNLSGMLYGGEMSGQIDFAPRPGGETWGYEGTLRATGVEIGPLLASWIPGAQILEGTLQGTTDLSGEAGGAVDPRRAMNLLGDVRLSDGAFRDLPGLSSLGQFLELPELAGGRWPFQSLATHFTIREGALLLEGLKLTQPGMDWLLSGQVGMDGRVAFSGTLRAAPDRFKLPTAVAFLAPYLAEADGRIPVDFRVEGPAQAPRVTLDWDTAARRASERVKTQDSEKVKGEIEKNAMDPETLQKLKQLLGGKKGGGG